MGRRIIIRPKVPDDLAQIIDYLATASPDTADRFAAGVEASFETLAAMPGMGSPKHFRSRRLAGIRSWFVKGFRSYLILYRPIEDGIEVLAVSHGSRRLHDVLRGR